MMYPFMTLDDQTEIVHSELLPDGRVKVYVEKPDEKDCFHNATCYLPEGRWMEVEGFTDAEMKRYQEIVERKAQLIMRLAAKGISQKKVPETCEHCAWLSDLFSQVCINAASPYVADFRDRSDTCPHWEEGTPPENLDESSPTQKA